jgi:hypothetical protein
VSTNVPQSITPGLVNENVVVVGGVADAGDAASIVQALRARTTIMLRHTSLLWRSDLASLAVATRLAK